MTPTYIKIVNLQGIAPSGKYQIKYQYLIKKQTLICTCVCMGILHRKLADTEGKLHNGIYEAGKPFNMNYGRNSL